MVSMYGDDGFRYVGRPEQAPWEKIEGWDWVSHNRSFDETAFNALDFPTCEGPSNWYCSADLAAFLGVKRDLATAAELLLGVEVDKTVRAKFNKKSTEQILKLMQGETEEYALEDARLTYEIWRQFGDQMPIKERWLSRHTTDMGMDGIGVDRDYVDSCISKLRMRLSDICAELPWLDMADSKGKPYTPLSRTGLIRCCEDLEIPPPKSTAQNSDAFDKWVGEYGDQAPFITALSEYRSVKRTLDVFESIRRRSEGYTMYFSLKYCGAHTGRWSGESGLNMHNFPRKPVLGCNLRNCFVPKPGMLFVVCDLAQIEARVLLWEVGDEEQLKLIASGMDVYEAHARATMGYNDPRPLEDVDPEMRRYAKVRVLGLGYGAGATTFQKVAAMYGMDLSPREAQKAVRQYRAKNKKIVDYWKNLERQVKRGGRENDGNYFDELPSGRFLTYREIGSGKLSTVAGRPRGFFHGGRLAENRVSAISRDVMAEGIILIERRYDVKLHVHDEVIVEVPEEEAEEGLAFVQECLSTTPEWAPGLPVSCGGKILTRYDKI